MSYTVTICLIYEHSFEIKKEHFKMGFPPEIYEAIMCIQGAYFLSHEIRKTTQVYLIFTEDNLVIHYFGDKLRYLGPDERSIGMLLMKALEHRENLDTSRKIQSSPGIWIQKRTIRNLFLKFNPNSQIILTDQNNSAEFGELSQSNLILLLSNIKNKSVHEENFLSDFNLFKMGIKDLPEKMKNFMTILKFYSIIDNI